ncbi:MAG: cell division protein ZipA C-terminal FtsZ-binding domain-containing protein, partial [Gammaproteobacteria bacterium]
FHRHEQPKDRRTPTLFSAANVLAPGHFEAARMDTLSSPGIAMFMRLPGPESPVDAFQQMLDAARIVAEDLNGTLCDETRSTLTPQSINHLRERIADFGRRQMLKA